MVQSEQKTAKELKRDRKEQRRREMVSMITNGTGSPVKMILWLSWPVLLEQVLHTLVSYADTAMVGALGAYATASVAISNAPVMMINGCITALGTGITALVAQAIGAQNYERAKALVRHALLVIVFIGLPASIVLGLLSKAIPLWMGAGEDVLGHATTYNIIVSLGRPFLIASMLINAIFRGRGDTKTPLLVNTAVNLVNIVGNFFLIAPEYNFVIFGRNIHIAGAGWGVAGAAASTSASFALGGIVMLIMVFKKKSEIQLSIHDSFKPDMPMVRQVITISVPAMLERACMGVASIISSASIASLGTVTVAANSLYVTAESMSFMPAFAFASAATTLVGQSMGAGNSKLGRKYNNQTLAIACSIMVVTGLALYLLAEPILHLFTPDLAVIALSARCLRLVAVLQPVQAFVWVLAGSLRGAGDTKCVFIGTAVTTWCIRALFTWLGIRRWGCELPLVVWLAGAEMIARGIIYLIRFRGTKWYRSTAAYAREQEQKAQA